MVGYKTTILIITFNVLDLNKLLKRDCQSGSKKHGQLYVVYKRPTLNIKTYKY